MKLTFEQLPEAVSQLFNKLDSIEEILLSQSKAIAPNEDELYNTKQAAQLLDLSVSTIYGLVHHREIPVCKRGKHLYFSKQELTAWIKSSRRKTISEIDIEAEQHLSNLRGKKANAL